MNAPNWLTKVSPFANKLQSYSREMFVGDLIGGSVVAIMLVPQAMAYAMLAGLPPQIGLYASILPLVLYGLFGTSNSLAVGPVAMISLLVVSGVGQLAEPGSPDFIALCLTLAAMVGTIQILMSVFRLGFLVNFISHPVLLGFTSAAAIVIAFSQLRHFFGVDVPRSEFPFRTIVTTISSLPESNWVVLTIGILSAALLLFAAFGLVPILRRFRVPESFSGPLSKFGPLVAVSVSAVIVGFVGLDDSHTVAIVGEVPSGLPLFAWPNTNVTQVVSLAPLAAVIAMIGFLESFSVAKALASRDREKIDANRELFALGLADIGAAVSGGYPVTGGFSRSVVSQSAGVRTPLGGMIAALLVAVSMLFLAPLFYYIPKSALAAIIIVAVVSLIDIRTPIGLWRYSHTDAIAWLVTFLAVIFAGIETGILIGACSTAGMLMWRVSRPHIAQVGRIPGSEHFRNVDRFKVETYPGIVAIRFDASLNFANAPSLESFVLNLIADEPELQSVLLVASGINDIDATGIATLATINSELATAGIKLYLSDVKGPVSDRLRRARFDEQILNEQIFISADAAVIELMQLVDRQTEKEQTRTPC